MSSVDAIEVCLFCCFCSFLLAKTSFFRFWKKLTKILVKLSLIWKYHRIVSFYPISTLVPPKFQKFVEVSKFNKNFFVTLSVFILNHKMWILAWKSMVFFQKMVFWSFRLQKWTFSDFFFKFKKSDKNAFKWWYYR